MGFNLNNAQSSVDLDRSYFMFDSGLVWRPELVGA